MRQDEEDRDPAEDSSRAAGSDASDRSFRLDARRVVRRLLGLVIVAECALLAGDYVFNFLDVAEDIRVRRTFNIAREESIPTWFASTQAVALGATAWVVSRLARRNSERAARLGWLMVAVFFLYVGIDDAASIHERAGSALAEAFESSLWAAQYPSFGWQIFLGPALALGLVVSATVIWRQEPSPGSRRLVVAGLVGFALAQGLDFLEGVENLYYDWSVTLELGEYTVSHTLRAAEEMLEMLSTTAFWAPVLWHLARRADGLRVEIATASEH